MDARRPELLTYHRFDGGWRGERTKRPCRGVLQGTNSRLHCWRSRGRRFDQTARPMAPFMSKYLPATRMLSCATCLAAPASS